MNLQTLEKTMQKMADKGVIRITRRYQTTADKCGAAPDDARKQGAESRISQVNEKTDNAAILRELARVKCEFQLRAVCAAIGLNATPKGNTP